MEFITLDQNILEDLNKWLNICIKEGLVDPIDINVHINKLIAQRTHELEEEFNLKEVK